MVDGCSSALLPGAANTAAPAAEPSRVQQILTTLGDVGLALFWLVVSIPLLPGLVIHGVILIVLIAIGAAVEGCCGSEAAAKANTASRLLCFGAGCPDEVPEAVLRQVAGRAECLRGAGVLLNFWYRFRHAHPLLSIMAVAWGHPYSPLERFGALLVVSSFSYAMAVAKDALDLSGWSNISFSLLLISLPCIALGKLLQTLATWDFQDTGLQEALSQAASERSFGYLESLIQSHGLMQELPPEPQRQPATGLLGFFEQVGNFLQFTADFAQCCTSCVQQTTEGINRACRAAVAAFFLGYSWAVSIGLLVLARYLDVKSHGGQPESPLRSRRGNATLTTEDQPVWNRFWLGVALQWLLACLTIAAFFALAWVWQHWHGRRVRVDCAAFGVGGEFPPELEPVTELQAVFDFLAREGEQVTEETVLTSLQGSQLKTKLPSLRRYGPCEEAIGRFVEQLEDGSWDAFRRLHLERFSQSSSWS